MRRSPKSTTNARSRRWPKRLAIAAVVVVVLAVAIPFTYIHFIEGKAPAKLTLTPAATTSGGGSGATDAGATTSGSITGAWSVASGSIVGYRVSETLIGQKNTAVGRTSAVTGRLAVSGTSVASATFTAQMASVTSDESQRDQQFSGRIMDVSQYPTATFTLTSPIDLGSIPSVGVIRSYKATGNLTLRGQTHPVTFTLNAERTSTLLEVQGEIPVLFATWGIPNPSFGSFVTTADNGTLELLLHLQRGSAAATSTSTTTTASSGQSGGGGGGGGGAITVPATTTPPLSIAG